MQSMQNFYCQLFTTEQQEQVYLWYMRKLTQLNLQQLAAGQTVLWWNGWSAPTV
ncbi:MAG: hypothetical protein U0350_43415 [Caldilineaceae bacterium]